MRRPLFEQDRCHTGGLFGGPFSRVSLSANPCNRTVSTRLAPYGATVSVLGFLPSSHGGSKLPHLIGLSSPADQLLKFSGEQ